MPGYKNRILRVDLTNRTFSEEQLSDELIHDYMGGRGFGVKLQMPSPSVATRYSSNHL